MREKLLVIVKGGVAEAYGEGLENVSFCFVDFDEEPGAEIPAEFSDLTLLEPTKSWREFIEEEGEGEKG